MTPADPMFPWRSGERESPASPTESPGAPAYALAPAFQKNMAEAAIAMERIDKARRMAASGGDEARILMAVVGKIIPAMQGVERAVLQAAPMAEIFANISATAHVLALNAELQVERAGVAGPALTVLAEELRSLAKQSASAGRAIPELVEAVSRDMGLGTALITAASDAVGNVNRQFHALANQLDTVVQSAAKQVAAARELEVIAMDLSRAARLSRDDADQRPM